MAQPLAGTPAQLDLAYDGAWPLAVTPVTKPRRRAARLCAVCGRARARLTIERERGGRPERLCLRCHNAVLRQRRSAEAGSGPAGPGRAAGGLIVPRASGLSAEAVSRRLSRSRRRAQKAARAALGAG